MFSQLKIVFHELHIIAIVSYECQAHFLSWMWKKEREGGRESTLLYIRLNIYEETDLPQFSYQQVWENVK